MAHSATLIARANDCDEPSNDSYRSADVVEVFDLAIFGRPAILQESDSCQSFLGKHILVGLTYLDEQGEVHERAQYHGTITSIDGEVLRFDRADGGGEFTIPFDGTLDAGEPLATYTLSTTGEVVEDVDFVCSWTIQPPRRH